jgi:hypothetical protein
MSDVFETGFKTGRVPALNGANFVEWLDLVKTVLLSKGLWEYASGDIPKPLTPERAREFEREDAKAAAYLKIAVGRQQWPHLLGLTSSRVVLDKLKAVHEVSQSERLPSLLSQFYGCESQATIDLTASKLTQLQLDIAAASQDEMPSDAMKKMILVQSLPVEYQSTVFALKAAGVSKISFDDMVQRLKETEIGLNKIPEKDINLARAVGHRHDRGGKQESNRPRG